MPESGGQSASITKPATKNVSDAKNVMRAQSAIRSRRKSRSPDESRGAGAMSASAPRHWKNLRFGSLLMGTFYLSVPLGASRILDADLHALAELQRR